jgi:molecular chaperone HtpG
MHEHQSSVGHVTHSAFGLAEDVGQAPEVKPVLEVNAEHALVKKLDGSVHFNDLAHILFDQALLAEGGMPADPAAYVKRVNALLV